MSVSLRKSHLAIDAPNENDWYKGVVGCVIAGRVSVCIVCVCFEEVVQWVGEQKTLE